MTIMNKYFTYFIALSCSLLSSAYASNDTQAYLCVSEHTTGFEIIDGNWQINNFKSGKKYIFKRVINKSKDNYIWEWAKFGDEHVGIYCTDGFSKYGNMKCERWGSTFLRFNNQSLRYMLNYNAGYVMGNKSVGTNLENTKPYMEIGTCTSI